MSNDLDAKHEQRGDVKCEGCGCWTRHYALTADECYVCRECAEQMPPASVAELIEYGHIAPRPFLDAALIAEQEGNR